MARLFSSGFELNSTTAGVEFTSISGLIMSISTTTVRSGTYALRINPSANAGTLKYQYRGSDTQGDTYIRFYLRIATAADANRIPFVIESTAGDDLASIRVNSNNTLELWDDLGGVQVGSDSSALSTDTGYRIELRINDTTAASTNLEARIDGTSFASGTVDHTGGPFQAVFQLGPSGGANTFDSFIDDVAINDNSGSFQNSWPGEGEIIHLRPNATGDNSAWGGTNTDIDEVTPDDNTTFINSYTLNETEDVNLDATPAGLASDDTINCVQVGVRYTRNAANPASFVVRIKASSGGTVEESAAITPPTGCQTNANANPRSYPQTLYDLPGASTTEWTKTDLDVAQIGARISTGSVGVTAKISTLWLLVDHKPAAPAGGATHPGWQPSKGGWW